MEIYLVRHGKTVWNDAHRLQGGSDIELTAEGREVAGQTGRALESVPFDCIYSSPLIRAYETANLIRGYRNIPIIRDERLREMSFGVYEGRDVFELLHDPEDPYHYFFEAPEKFLPPEGGETFEEVIARAESFMKEIVEPYEDTDRRIMIVAHGAMNGSLMTYMEKRPLEKYWGSGLQKNCGVNIIRLDKDGYHLLEEQKIYY